MRRQANSNDNGDVHSWNVWSGSAPIEDYLKDTPRFVSEYGFEALPDMRTIRAFATPEEQTLDSPVMRAHQKFANGNGNDRLLVYLRRYYGEPKDFPAFVYLSQVMQARGYRAGSGASAREPAALDGLALLAAQRLLAGSIVGQHRFLRQMEGAAVSCAPLL